MNESATIFITEQQDANLYYEIADEALEAVAHVGGGCPTLMYNSYCFTCDNETRSITLTNYNRLPIPVSSRYSRLVYAMSALPPKADIAERRRHVRIVPKADINHFSERRGMSGQARATCTTNWPSGG
jgi:hypothetical protein